MLNLKEIVIWCSTYCCLQVTDHHHTDRFFCYNVSASKINEPLVYFLRKITFHVWASRGLTVIFLKILPMQHLFREMVFIHDWNWNYIIGAVFEEIAVCFPQGGMKALSRLQRVMGNLNKGYAIMRVFHIIDSFCWQVWRGHRGGYRNTGL
jgi:hypothetical protein